MASLEELCGSVETICVEGRSGCNSRINGRYLRLPSADESAPAIYENKRTNLFLYVDAETGEGVISNTRKRGGSRVARKDAGDGNAWLVYTGEWEPDDAVATLDATELDAIPTTAAVAVVSRWGNLNGGFRLQEEDADGRGVYFNEEDAKFLACVRVARRRRARRCVCFPPVHRGAELDVSTGSRRTTERGGTRASPAPRYSPDSRAWFISDDKEGAAGTYDSSGPTDCRNPEDAPGWTGGSLLRGLEVLYASGSRDVMMWHSRISPRQHIGGVGGGNTMLRI